MFVFSVFILLGCWLATVQLIRRGLHIEKRTIKGLETISFTVALSNG